MIDRDSRVLLSVMYLCALAISLAAIFLFDNLWIVCPVCAAMVWFCLWQAFFFHVPEREYAGTEKSVTAVSDGRVVICEKVYESEVLKVECFQVSVYMNFFDVHANFWPVTGEIEKYVYNPGKHLLAFNPKSSIDNEHSCITLKVGDARVSFKQIAGGFARRIVCHAEPGQHVDAGTQCGIIKFGSRIDYLLPLDAAIKVKLGDVVRACETIVAELA